MNNLINKLFNKYCKNKKGLSKRDITKLIREEYKDNHSNNIIISLMNIWGVKIDGKYYITKKIFTENDKCYPSTKYGLVRFKTENILKKLLFNRLLTLRVSNILIFDLRSDKISKNFITRYCCHHCTSFFFNICS